MHRVPSRSIVVVELAVAFAVAAAVVVEARPAGIVVENGRRRPKSDAD